MNCYCGWCSSQPGFLEHVQAEHGDAYEYHTPMPENSWSHNNQGHWKDCRFCDETEHRTQVGEHRYNGGNTCTVCGFKKGTTFSGTVTSFGTAGTNLNLQLIPSGSQEPVFEADTDKNNGNFSFSGVEAGTYTVKVSKENHVTREYEVTIGNEPVNLDVKLHLVGDITGDGQINIMDVNRANLHFKKKITLTGYEFDCANITGDTQVNIMDVNRMNLHFKGKSKLW